MTCQMPRPERADEARGLYLALNRGNHRTTIFHRGADNVSFERILGEGVAIYLVELFDYRLMPNHYHQVLRPVVDGEMSPVHEVDRRNAHHALSCWHGPGRIDSSEARIGVDLASTRPTQETKSFPKVKQRDLTPFLLGTRR